MGLGFGQLAKLMKGGLDPDQLAEMLGAMGLGADVAAVTSGQVPVAFQKLWEAGQEPGVTILRVELRKQNGDKITGLLVLGNGDPHPQGQAEPSKGEKLLPQPA
ncbi:MAG: hypothetical protein ACLQMG_13530 [Terracidiphilus sp.]